MRKIIIVAHNLRSSHNVGSLLRTAEGLAVDRVYLTGYTPYPLAPGDERLPHIARKVDAQIAKTALGAETMVDWRHYDDIEALLKTLKADGFSVLALEQTETSAELPGYEPPDKLAIIVGREVEGIEPAVLALVDQAIEIPMLGRKESFNVVQAAAMALYHCRFA